MSYLYTKNSTPTNGHQYMFLLKALLKTAGWTVPRSGDGLALYSSSADIITTNTTGAGGLANANAWFIMKQPGVVATAQRHLLFQTSGDGYNWRVKYSWNAGFTVGTSNATTTPSASDQQVLVGSGTDAAPGFSNLLPTGYGTSTRAQFVANNAAPYEFLGISHPTGGGFAMQAILMDGLLSGSYNVLDVDPYLFYFEYGSPFTAPFTNISNGTGPFSNYKKNLAGAAYVNTPGLTYNDQSGVYIPGNVGVDPYSSKDQIYPLLYGRSLGAGAPTGIKGQSNLLRWCSNPRSTGDCITVTTTRDYYCVMGSSPYCICFPWDGSTPSV